MKKSPDIYYFDEDRAQRPVNFIERYCRHVEGELQGQRIDMMDYQKEIVRDVHGWRKKKDRRRRYRYVYLEVPKKNAKSTLLSGLGLYHTCADGEKGALVVAVAGDKLQARIIFDAARNMVEADKKLSAIFDVYKDSIFHRKTKSRFIVVSADAPTKHGLNISVLLFDELHVQPNRELYDTLAKGVAARAEPLVYMISTAGYQNTFAHTMHRMAKAIQEGRLVSKFWYVRTWGATAEEAQKHWDKEWLWEKTNPGYGTTVGKEFFEAQIEEVRQNPAGLSAFLRLHLNVWTGSEKTWEIVPHWHKGDGEIDVESLRGRPCYLGVDLAPKNDTTAVVELYPSDDGQRFTVLVQLFIPRATLDERIRLENDNWQVWVDAGLVTVMPGNVTDDDVIFQHIRERCQFAQAEGIACDDYNAWGLIANLQAAGLPAESYPQTVKGMSPPMQFLEKCVTAGQLRHGGHPVLSWQAGNVVVYEDINQNRRPHKKNSKARIDGISALIFAFGLYLASITDVEDTYSAADLLGFIETEAPKNTTPKTEN